MNRFAEGVSLLHGCLSERKNSIGYQNIKDFNNERIEQDEKVMIQRM